MQIQSDKTSINKHSRNEDDTFDIHHVRVDKNKEWRCIRHQLTGVLCEQL